MPPAISTTSSYRRRWRVVVRDSTTAQLPRRDFRDALVVVGGVVAALLATGIARALPLSVAPLTLVLVLVFTLVAGRMAPVWPALAHGACAWMTILIAGGLAHPASHAWLGVPAPLLSLVLIEDMALIGRVGFVRHLIARERLVR